MTTSVEPGIFAAWLATTGDAAIAMDNGGRVVLHNPAASRVSGLAPDHAAQRGWTEVLRLSPRVAEAVWNVRISRRPLRIEADVLCADGNLRRAELVAAPWRDAKGHIGVLVLIHDPAPPPARPDAGPVGGFGGLIGSDPAMQTVYKLVDAVAPCRVPVLIEGEPGTGKERVAQLLHSRSGRAERPLMQVECAGLSASALELELFGRAAERSLSRSTVLGRAELAHGGTLVLHHITEMAPGLQARVLRLIESGTVERVGDAAPHHVDVRVAATTEHPLEAEAREGRFREDLAHHLRTIHLQLPPLRDRMGDLLPLIEHFLGRHAPEQYALDSRAMAAMYAHVWPGNVGELERVLEHAVAALPSAVEADPRVITLDALPREVQRRAERLPAPGGFARREEDRRTRILRALAAHGGNRSAAARALGIGRATFYRWWGEAGLA